MADERKQEWSRPRWKPGGPLPWAKFFWTAWLSNPAILALSWEQQGRFMRVWASTHGTKTPGVMTEDQVRGWAGYAPAEWRANREAFVALFNTTRTPGKWRLEDVIEIWKASHTVAVRKRERAVKAAETRHGKRPGRNGLGATSNAPSNARSTRQAVLGADQMLDTTTFGGGEIEITRSAVPDPGDWQPDSNGHSPVAVGGTDAEISALLRGALRASGADGMDGTKRSGGGAP